jgi:hypothetical protein
MTLSRLLAIAAAAVGLSGCLVSNDPLFGAETASATPIASGRYNACTEPPEDNDPCQVIGVTQQDDGSYEFLVEDSDRIAVRFHALGGDHYAAQFADDDGDGYFYFWAQTAGDTLSLVMIWCADLPAALRETMKKDGLIDFSEGSGECTALRPEAVAAAAAAYRDGAAKSDSVLKLTPAP